MIQQSLTRKQSLCGGTYFIKKHIKISRRMHGMNFSTMKFCGKNNFLIIYDSYKKACCQCPKPKQSLTAITFFP